MTAQATTIGTTNIGRRAAHPRITEESSLPRIIVSPRTKLAAGAIAVALSIALLTALLPSMAGAPVPRVAPHAMPAPTPIVVVTGAD
jgi:hypothetical protein